MKPVPVLVFPALALTALLMLPVAERLLAGSTYYGRHITASAPDFTLVDVNGKPVTLRSFRGSFVFLFFGYTRCNEACPRAFGTCFSLLQANPDPRLKVLFVDIDTNRDRAEQLCNLSKGWDTRMMALRGSEVQLRKLTRAYRDSYGVLPAKDDEKGQIRHAGRLYLIDPEGQLQLSYQTEQQDLTSILKDLRELQSRGRNHAI